MKIDLKNPQTQFVGVITIVMILIGYLMFKLGTIGPNGILAEASTTLAVTKDSHIRGSRDAEIIIFEFSDYECPFCAKHHPTLQAIVDAYDGQVAWVFNHFPLSTHTNAHEKAEASECVAELGGNEAFWSFTDAMFEAGTHIDMAQVKTIALQTGIDESDYQSCLDSGRHSATVDAQLNLGLSSGVQGTPGNIILNVKTGQTQLIPGALPQQQLESVIDQIL